MADSFSTQIIRYREGHRSPVQDFVAVEEPLEIFIDYFKDGSPESMRLAITMRTPGQDFDLAAGLLYNEGIISAPDDIIDIQTCGDVSGKHQVHNTVRVQLSPDIEFKLEEDDRRFIMNSSCGICGKTSIEALEIQAPSLKDHQLQIKDSVILSLPEKLLVHQSCFEATGGLHACALFDHQGTFISLREDVGRHNALDKLIGSRIRHELDPFKQSILLLSGRISFELVQKAAMAGLPIIIAIGAPSSLAIDTAKHFGITLIGFLKKQCFNIYCGEERVSISESS